MDIYRLAGFHRLPQTQRSPYHRGPHRLTKMTEAASQQVSRLNQHPPTSPATYKPPTRRQLPTISYDNKNFPSLPRKQAQFQARVQTTTQPSTTPQPTARSDPVNSHLNEKLLALEKQVNQQQEHITNLQQQLQQQQDAIQRLTTLTEDQQKNVNNLTESVNQLTNSVTKLEKLATTILQNLRKDPPTPDNDQPIKRSRLRSDDSSTAHLYRPPPDVLTLDDTTMEQDHPNASPSNSLQSSSNE